MTDFVGDEKRSLERRAGIFVQNEAIACNEHSARAIEHNGPLRRNFHIKAPTLCFGFCELIRLPRIEPICDSLRVQSGSGLPGEFDRIHVNRLRIGAAHAFRRALLRRSADART